MKVKRKEKAMKMERKRKSDQDSPEGRITNGSYVDATNLAYQFTPTPPIVGTRTPAKTQRQDAPHPFSSWSRDQHGFRHSYASNDYGDQRSWRYATNQGDVSPQDCHPRLSKVGCGDLFYQDLVT